MSAGTLTAVEAAEARLKAGATVPDDDGDGADGRRRTGFRRRAPRRHGWGSARRHGARPLRGAGSGHRRGRTAFVESAQAAVSRCCHDRAATRVPHAVEDASTFGVGEWSAEAASHGATEVGVGPGRYRHDRRSAPGMSAALATSEPVGALTAGATGLAELVSRRRGPRQGSPHRADLVAASDVHANPLLGLRGAINVFAAEAALPPTACSRSTARWYAGLPATWTAAPADAKGAGALRLAWMTRPMAGWTPRARVQAMTLTAVGNGRGNPHQAGPRAGPARARPTGSR